jgi:hypothetical protein
MRTSRGRSGSAERAQDQQRALRNSRKSSGPAGVAQDQQRVLRTGRGHFQDQEGVMRAIRRRSGPAEGDEDQQRSLRTSRGLSKHTQCPVGCWMTYRVASTAPALLEYIYYWCRCFSSVLFRLLTGRGVQMLCDMGRFYLTEDWRTASNNDSISHSKSPDKDSNDNTKKCSARFFTGTVRNEWDMGSSQS